MATKKHAYRFAVVNFQASMQDAEVIEPLAVVVQNGCGTLYIQGRHLSDVGEVSEIGREYLRDLPDALKRQAESVATGTDLFEHLSSVNQWNVFLSPPKSEESSMPIHLFAAQVFQTCVVEHLGNEDGVELETYIKEIQMAVPA